MSFLLARMYGAVPKPPLNDLQPGLPGCVAQAHAHADLVKLQLYKLLLRMSYDTGEQPQSESFCS